MTIAKPKKSNSCVNFKSDKKTVKESNEKTNIVENEHEVTLLVSSNIFGYEFKK